MATAGGHNPWMGSISVTGAAASLWSYLSTVWSDLPHKCCYLQLQLDTTAGGSTVSIGNSNVATAMKGAQLVATQIGQTFAFDSNLLVLDDIFLLASAGTVVVNCIVVVR